jgi:putative ABC transport system permease protein
MAFTDARASRSRLVFVILAVAAGVAALTGVKGFSESTKYTLFKEARTLMGADLMIRMNVMPNQREQEFLESLRLRGIDSTRVTETVSMAAAAGPQSTPVLSSIKAADLTKYPFYGVLELEPAHPEMAADTVVVSEDLLLRLAVHVGDYIKVGDREYRIVAVATKEPDRMTTGFTLGPRVLMTREGFERSGLNVFGSRATQRLLLRLPPGANPEQTRSELRDVFRRRGRIIDYTEANPTLSRNMDRATSFLAMVSLIALIVGGVGVATSIESHIQQRMDHIAIMKCLGGRSGRVMQIYAAQSLMLGLAGSVIGVIVGFFVQAVFPQFLAGYFDVNIQLILSWKPVVQGLGVGLLTALLFTIPPILSISRIRPGVIFRRNMVEHDTNPARLAKPQVERYVSIAVIAAGIWAIAVWMSGSARIGSYFAGGLVGSLVVLAGIARLVLRGLRRLMSAAPLRMSPVLRQGVANLYRPGTHVTAILVALGVGVMFTLTVQLLQESLLDQLRISAPPDSPNVFLINVTDAQKDDLWQLIRSQPGIREAPAASPAVAGQLSRINGTPVEEIQLSEGEQRYFRTQFALSWSESVPKATEILAGSWWPAAVNENLVSVEESAADALKLSVGDSVEWSVQGRVLAARVSSIRRTDAARLGANNQFILSPAALRGFPVIYFGAIRVQPTSVGALQRAVFDRFPTVTVVNAADVLEIVQGVVDRISTTVRFLAAFAIAGGAIILASAVAGTRYRRMREVAILKTLGATRGKIIRIFSLEFLIVGIIAGAIGAGLASVFTVIVVDRLFHSFYAVSVVPIVASIALTALIAVVAGWAASFRILGQKPLEVLRQSEN